MLRFSKGNDLTHGAYHGIVCFAWRQGAGVGGLVRHACLVYTDIQHEFPPQAMQDIVFSHIGDLRPVQEVSHGF